MRVLIDYRAALRSRSGVGEYVHQLVSALGRRARQPRSSDPVEVTIFSSSWKDRVRRAPELDGVPTVDRRVPVRLLNFAWHRLGWPPADVLAGGRFDVTHSLHPLLMPARTAARVITIHDLNFLAHPERTTAEIRRDYPRLARTHAHRADAIIVPSRFTAGEVEQRLEVPPSKIFVCSPGAPEWLPRDNVPAGGYALFFGTLEPRKNVGALLDAYAMALNRYGSEMPELVLAGKATPEAQPWLTRLSAPPLAGRVRHIGYVDPDSRRELYLGARLLVQPSFEEGFGLPVLEAMKVGVPVVAADRGALPEVVEDAGLLIDPADTASFAAAMHRMVADPGFASACVSRGIHRAARFRWDDTADRVAHVYRAAMVRRRERS